MKERPTSRLCFAYGSNLDGGQMKERCPGARVVGPATLPDHALAFVGHSERRKGAVATVVPEAGAQVCGLLYELTDADWHALDRKEGYPNTYRRPVLEVVDAQGLRVAAHVYVHSSRDRRAPHADYVDVIRSAYATLGLDVSLLERALSA